MQIRAFPPHYQLVYINIDISSFSLISYIAKVWFLFFECCVVAICLECYRNPSAAFWQSVRSRRGLIYRARIYIFATHFVCVWLILKACYGSFAL